MSESNVTLFREVCLQSSGFKDEGQMGEALLNLVASIGSDLIDKGTLQAGQVAGLQQALRDTPIAYRSIAGTIKNLRGLTADQRGNLHFAFVKMMDDMLSLGSVVGSIDGIGLSVIRGAKRGGKQSAKRRAEKSETWKAIAREMAMEIQAANPAWSQDDLASEVKTMWREETPPAPGHSTIKALISQMQGEGTLARPNKS